MPFGDSRSGRAPDEEREAASYGSGAQASWSYDAVGQVLGSYQGADGAVQTGFGYGYDAAGNRQYRRFADGREERYGYDAIDRLTSAEYPTGRRVEYGYDLRCVCFLVTQGNTARDLGEAIMAFVIAGVPLRPWSARTGARH